MSGDPDVGELAKRLDRLESTAMVCDPDHHEFEAYLRLKQRVATLEDDVADAKRERTAAVRMAVSAIDISRDIEHVTVTETKTSHAKALARNELVRRVAVGVPASDRAITRVKLIDLGHPDVAIEHQTAKRAFAQLVEDYPGVFFETRKSGQKALSIVPDELCDNATLIHRVALSTGRSDIVVSLLGEGDPLVNLVSVADTTDIETVIGSGG